MYVVARIAWLTIILWETDAPKAGLAFAAGQRPIRPIALVSGVVPRIGAVVGTAAVGPAVSRLCGPAVEVVGIFIGLGVTRQLAGAGPKLDVCQRKIGSGKIPVVVRRKAGVEAIIVISASLMRAARVPSDDYNCLSIFCALIKLALIASVRAIRPASVTTLRIEGPELVPSLAHHARRQEQRCKDSQQGGSSQAETFAGSIDPIHLFPLRSSHRELAPGGRIAPSPSSGKKRSTDGIGDSLPSIMMFGAGGRAASNVSLGAVTSGKYLHAVKEA
jgi:hypothetical protein